MPSKLCWVAFDCSRGRAFWAFYQQVENNKRPLTLFLERSGITFPGEGGSICHTYTLKVVSLLWSHQKVKNLVFNWFEPFSEWKYLTLFLERSGITLPGEGGSICPTYSQGSLSALKPTKGQKSCFHISLDSFQLIWAFFGGFFTNHKKNATIKNLTKTCQKMGEISKFCNFGLISTYYTSKESIFHVKFNFIQKKHDFMKRKLIK